MSNVSNLVLIECGQYLRFDSDKVLDGAKGLTFKKLMIVGELEDGSLYTAGNANVGEIMVMMEWAKHLIAFGKDGRET